MPSAYARIPTSSISITTFRPVPQRRDWVQADLADARGISEYAAEASSHTKERALIQAAFVPATRAPPPWRGACS